MNNFEDYNVEFMKSYNTSNPSLTNKKNSTLFLDRSSQQNKHPKV